MQLKSEKNLKKRIGSIVLLVVFTLFTLVSCGEKSLPEAQNAAKELSTAYIEGDDEFLEAQVDETLELGQEYYDLML